MKDLTMTVEQLRRLNVAKETIVKVMVTADPEPILPNSDLFASALEIHRQLDKYPLSKRMRILAILKAMYYHKEY